MGLTTATFSGNPNGFCSQIIIFIRTKKKLFRQLPDISQFNHGEYNLHYITEINCYNLFSCPSF